MSNPSSTDKLEIAVADVPSQMEVTNLVRTATNNAVTLARLANESFQLNRIRHDGLNDYVGDDIIYYAGKEQLAWAVVQPDTWQSLSRITRDEGHLLLWSGTVYVPVRRKDCIGYAHMNRCVTWHEHMGEPRNSRNPLWVQMLSETNVQIEAAIALFDSQ